MSGESYDVKDRRAFNPDGTPRKHEAEEQSQEPIILEPGRDESDSHASQQHQLPPVDFLTFTFPLIAEAFAYMGVGMAPSEEEPKIDLPIAKHLIDTLGMLQEKTKGNLTAAEERQLNDALRDLRLQYVSLLNAKPA